MLLGGSSKRKASRIKAAPKLLTHFKNQIAHRPVTGIALLEVPDLSWFGIGIKLIKAKSLILALGSIVFSHHHDLPVGRAIKIDGAHRVDVDQKAR